jgi:beta-lactamase regulating signal transducer with metallopeptidase domain
VALILLKKHSAAVRYYVTLTALATVFLLAVVTFLGKYGAATERTVAPAVAYAPAPTVAQAAGTTGGVLPASLTRDFAGYFAGHFPLVVLGWAAGVLVLLLRLVGGLAYAARMKSYQVTDADAGWQQKTASLAERLGLRRPARLLESGLAKVPMTIGYLKPVILLPLGALAGLAPAQVEAILAHELAHIRRHDYLVNLVQSLLEILLFYHPAVWWLSARVREEREHCCDDLAVALCSDSVTFARALVRLEERYGQAPALAMAATGRDGMLLGRIKRLLAPGRRTPTFVEGFIVALVLLAGVGVVSVSAARPPENKIKPQCTRNDEKCRPGPGSRRCTAGRTHRHYFQWTDSTDAAAT